MVDSISDDELRDMEMKGSKSSINKRSNKYERTRDNSTRGPKQTMQCLNPMQLGPPASQSKGDSLSSKMLLNTSESKLLGTSLRSSTLPISGALPTVPTYNQSLLDIDCEGGYNIPDSESSQLLVPLTSGDASHIASPANNIPLITSPSSFTAFSSVREEPSTDIPLPFSTQTTGPTPLQATYSLPPLAPTPSPQYYPASSKTQPSTQGI